MLDDAKNLGLVTAAHGLALSFPQIFKMFGSLIRKRRLYCVVVPTTQTNYLPERFSFTQNQDGTITYSTNIKRAMRNRQTATAVGMALSDVMCEKISEQDPLNQSICCESLDKIFTHPNNTIRDNISISFEFENREITVCSDGELTITEPESGQWSASLG